jgi:hypothetical protein
MASNRIYLQVDLSSENAQQNVNALNNAIASMGPAADKSGQQASTGLNKVSVSVESVSKSFSDLNAAIGALGIGRMLSELISLSSQYDRAQRALTSFTGSAQVAKQVLDQIRQIADESPFEFKDLQEAARQMVGFGYAAKDVPTYIKAVTDQVAAFGGSVEDVQKIIGVFGRVAAKDFVSSMDLFRQLATQGVDIMTALREKMSKQLGRPIGVQEVREAIKAGILDPAQTMITAVEEMQRRTAGFGASLKDPAKSIKVVGDELRQTAAAFGDAFAPAIDQVLVPVKHLLDYLQQLSPETKEWIVDLTALALAIMGIGTAWKIAAAVAGPALTVLTAGVKGLWSALTLLVTNPEILLGILGISAALYGLYKLVPGMEDWVDKMVGAGWEKITGKFKEFSTAMKSAFVPPKLEKGDLVREAEGAFDTLTDLVQKHADEAGQILLKAYASPIEAVYFKYQTLFTDLEKKIKTQAITPEHAEVLRGGLTAARGDELRAEQIKERKQELDEFQALWLEKIKGTRDAETAYIEAQDAQDLRRKLAAVDKITEIRIQAETDLAKVRDERINAEYRDFEEFANKYRQQFADRGINVDDMLEAHRKKATDAIQLSDQKAFDESQKYRLEGWKKANDLIIEDQKRIFEGFRDIFDQVFDAFTGKAADMGKAIGDMFKKLALGEARELFSSSMAGMATQAAGYGTPEESFPSQGKGLIGLLIRRGGVPPRPPLTAPEPLGGIPGIPTETFKPFMESADHQVLASETFAEAVKQFAAAVQAIPGAGAVATDSTGALPAAIPQASSLPAIPPQASPALTGLAPGIQGMISQAATQYGVPANVLGAMLQVESGGRASAVSKAGAVGLMQFMPATAAQYGVMDRTDARQSIFGAAHYLSDLNKQFGSMPLALAAYNAGPGAVTHYGGVPPYAETQAYVNRVTQLAGGVQALAAPESLQSQIPAEAFMGPSEPIPGAQYAFSGAEALELPKPSAAVPGVPGSLTTAPTPSELASMPMRSNPALMIAATGLGGVMKGPGGLMHPGALSNLGQMFGVGGAFGGGTSLGSILTSKGTGSLALMGGMALMSKGLQKRSTGITALGGGMAGVGGLLMDPKLLLKASGQGGGLAGALGAGAAVGVGTGLFMSGMQKGGGMGVAMDVAGGALAGAGIGFMFGGPLGAAIGAGVGAAAGAVAGVVRLMVKTETERIRAQIKQVYGIDIPNQQILGQIKQIVDQTYGGSVSIGIRSQQVQDIVRLFALSTGQAAKLPRPMYAATIAQSQAGGLALQPVFQGGVQVQNPYTGPTTYQYQTAVTAAQGLMAGTSQGVPGASGINSSMFVQLNPQQATDLFTGKTVAAIQQNPAAVASASASAARSGDSRTTMASNMLEPLTALS